MQETPVRYLAQEDPLEKGQATHSSVLGFPGSSTGKESTCNVEDLSSMPGLGRSPGEGNSSILVWRIPWTEKPGRLHSPWGCKETDMTEQLSLSPHIVTNFFFL